MSLKQNILVVDDTPANLHLLTEILSKQGYKVRAATNGPLALRSAQSMLPDLILLDITMAGMDGYEVCRQLKTDERTRDIPVIFISALDELSNKVKAFEVGGVDYITKPFQAEEVLVRVKTHLTLRATQRQLQKEIAERRRTEEELQQRHRELILINQAGQLFNSTLELDEVLMTVLEEVRRLLMARSCSVWLLDPNVNQLVCRQATEPNSSVVRGSGLAIGQGIIGWVVQHGQSVLIADTRLDPRHFKNIDKQTNLELRSIMGVPLQVKRQVIGALEAVDVTINRFKATDLRLLESLADHAAIAIDNARLYSERRESEGYSRKPITSCMNWRR